MILSAAVPTGQGVNAFLPVLVLHQSALCALRIHIPAHQELPLSSLTGVRLHWAIMGEKPVRMFLSLILHLYFPQSSRLVTVSFISFFLSLYLPLCSVFLVSVCLTISVRVLLGLFFTTQATNPLKRSTVTVIGSKLAPARGQLSVMFAFWA